MALKVTSLDELDPDLVAQLQAEFSQLVQEKFPEVELMRGPIHDIIHFLAGGVAGAVKQTEVTRTLRSNSLLAIQTDPALSDADLVDRVLSNLLISRKVGAAATGEITIVVEGDTSVVISTQQVFTATGWEFTVNEAIVAKPPGSEVLESTDRVLTPRGDGSYEFTVPATASEIGEGGNIPRNTKLLPDPLISRFVTAYAALDFTGGITTEDNAGLLARVDEGIPAKVMQGRKNIVALIKDQAAFQNTKHYSIIGYGDVEMTRDQHGIFPVSGGGRIDIYARTGEIPLTTTLKKNAVLVQILGTANSIWQFAITRDDAPGFYKVSQIRRPVDPTDMAGFSVTSDVRSFDLADDVYAPDILTAEEAAYTRYQTAVIKFQDTETLTASLAVGAIQEYDVGILAQPLIRELQAFANSGDDTNLMADVLIKSAVPCFVTLNFDIIKNSNETSPTLDPIKQALVSLINNMDFPGVIYTSQIADVVHDFLSGSMALTAIDMHGHIRRVDGSVAIIRDPHALTIPESPSTLVTPHTTAFILYAENIGISVRTRT